MADVLNKRERVQAALRGEELDHVPVSAWGHDYLREWSAKGLADATVEAYRRYDWDFIKVNPRASYYAEAWGARFKPSGEADKAPELTKSGLTSATSLSRIHPVDPSEGAFGEQLQALKLIARRLRKEVPFVQTVFTPLAVLSRMSGDTATVRRFMRDEPSRLERAVEAITETLEAYATACLKAGADGIFLATVEWGNSDTLSEKEFDRWVRPYDLRILDAARRGSFNIMHVCRANNLLRHVLDYPVHAFNWAAHNPGNPSLQEIASLTHKAVIGGIDHEGTIINGHPGEVVREAQLAIAQTGSHRLLLAPGCSIPPLTPEINLRALKEAALSGIPGGRRRELH
jgi:uroporphyrinogen decarboxylase